MSDQQHEIAQGGQPIVYIRPVKTAQLPKRIRGAASGLDEVYAIHGENGEYLGLAKDRAMAFVYAKQNDMAPVSVH